MIRLTVNGQAFDLDIEDDTPLLWVLRDHLGLKGTKFGCGAALCGACTVHVDGELVRSCVRPLASLDGATVTTIEGVSDANGDLHPVQQAWMDEGVPQCGYCQSGMIMSAIRLLEVHPDPSDAQIAEFMTNLCRCGTYARVARATKRAAKS